MRHKGALCVVVAAQQHDNQLPGTNYLLNCLANRATLTLCAFNHEFFIKNKWTGKKLLLFLTTFPKSGFSDSQDFMGKTKVSRRGPSRGSTRTGGWMAAVRGQRRDQEVSPDASEGLLYSTAEGMWTLRAEDKAKQNS